MEPLYESCLELLTVASGERRCLYQAEGIFEAPNWHPENYLIINREGRLYRCDLSGGGVSPIDTGFAVHCNNDHGISPDGRQLVVSHHSDDDDGQSVLYVLPVEGGEPRRVTPLAPSYWHGWSPDGRTLAYVGGRTVSADYDIYAIDLDGGEERRLTSGVGLDDGPEYSPDGRHIYYNSWRSGRMQIWRMNADGSDPRQLVESLHSDWFPHPSPDGSQLVFLRYLEDQGQDHPFGRDVQLILLELATGEIRELTPVFFGGQGTINVPSWSPDGTQLAFVSYRERD